MAVNEEGNYWTPGDEPAFPQQEDGMDTGMTMREWYAGMAMQALIANEAELTPTAREDIADQSFAMADAMLERAQK